MNYLNDYSPLLDYMIRLNKSKVIVEIGVQKGQTTYALCLGAKETGGKVFGFDIWSQHGLNKQFPQIGSKEEVENLLKENNLDNFLFTIKNTQDEDFPEFLKNLIGEQIDFAFIDGCHSYKGVLKDLQAVFPLLSDKGIVAFHDTRMIDGCRELMFDLRTKYYDGTYDIVDFIGGYGAKDAGVSFLIKKQFYILNPEVSEYCGTVNKNITEIEQEWYLEHKSRPSKIDLMSVNTDLLEMKF